MMTALAKTVPPKKARMSLIVDLDKKQALEQLAKRQNRTLNYLMGELVDKALQETKDETDYEAYVQERVMRAYQDVLDGRQGIAFDECFDVVRQHGKAYAQTKG